MNGDKIPATYSNLMFLQSKGESSEWLYVNIFFSVSRQQSHVKYIEIIYLNQIQLFLVLITV